MKLKEKCRTCLGCGLLEDKGFYGRKKCKYYIKDKEPIDWLEIIALVIFGICFIGFIIAIVGWCIKFNMLAGG